MTVRGGIADLIQAVGEGQMLIAYSGGLHHVQAPGEHLPRLFKTVRLNLELVDLRDYRDRMLERGGKSGFRRAVIRDMEERRDRFCPIDPAAREEPRAGSSGTAEPETERG